LLLGWLGWLGWNEKGRSDAAFFLASVFHFVIPAEAGGAFQQPKGWSSSAFAFGLASDVTATWPLTTQS
jgi:hypothetical protein